MKESYSNGSSWYRIYSDGWCEQGGISSRELRHEWEFVQLIKSYKDTNYSIILGNHTEEDQSNPISSSSSTKLKKNNSFYIGTRYFPNYSDYALVIWQTSGYIA